MRDFNLDVNDRIEVVVEDKSYKTLVVDVQEDFLKINIPVHNGDYLMLHTGEKIEMNSYLDENRCFNFHSEVISRGKEGTIVYYKISTPFDIKKIQRRNFFRVGLLDTIEYKNITNINKGDIDNIPYKEALMVDLSGGGLKLKTKDDIKKDDMLLISMMIKDTLIELKADVVRVENTVEKENVCGVRFLDITEAQIDIIIQELFEIVRRQRAKL